MSRVFVSYSHRDESAARSLKTALADRGYDVWLASDEIKPGERVSEKIREGLRSASVVVLLIGRHPTTWARYEWSEALERAWDPVGEVRLLPVVLPGADTPSFLAEQPLLQVHRRSDWEDVVSALDQPQTASRWRTSEKGQSALVERLNELEEVAAKLPEEPSEIA